MFCYFQCLKRFVTLCKRRHIKDSVIVIIIICVWPSGHPSLTTCRISTRATQTCSQIASMVPWVIGRRSGSNQVSTKCVLIGHQHQWLWINVAIQHLIENWANNMVFFLFYCNRYRGHWEAVWPHWKEGSAEWCQACIHHSTDIISRVVP